MSAKSNSDRQKAYRVTQKDPICQESNFVNSRAANISPFVQFALSLQNIYEQGEIDKDLIDHLISDAMQRVEEDENILVARSLKRRMEEFITNKSSYTEDENTMYYIYRNWVAEKKAVIHKGSCSFCNDGKGLQVNSRGNKNGVWSQGYNAYEIAREAAEDPYEGHDDLEVKICSVCLKTKV
jgi:hypothetical protein